MDASAMALAVVQPQPPQSAPIGPASLQTTTAETATRIPPRRFKASELPLPSNPRAAIESLVEAFKKEGGYDARRKEAWAKFDTSVGPTVAELRLDRA